MKTSKLILTLSIIILITTLLTLIITLNKFGVITGRSVGTDTGAANVTISSQASISFTDASCDFGAGSVNEDNSSATIDSEGTVTDGSWTPIPDCLTIKNDGNVAIQVNVSSSADTSTFIGGTGDTMKWKSSCAGGAIDTYTEISAGVGADACDSLAIAGTLDIDMQLVIPEDAPATANGAVITATGTSI